MIFLYGSCMLVTIVNSYITDFGNQVTISKRKSYLKYQFIFKFKLLTFDFTCKITEFTMLWVI